MKKAYVIVDGYSSGRLLVDAFNQKFKGNNDVVIIHVQSTAIPYTAMAAPEISKYHENIVFTGSTQEVINKLKSYDVMAVLAGQEPGVELADKLSEAMDLPTTNGTQRSSARRNKYDMIKTIDDAGLAAPKYIRSNNLDEILKWIKLNTQYPVVIKALRSAGTDGVYISSNEDDLRAAFAKLHGSETIYNELNDDVLVESFLDGNEYVINAVSLEGKHYVSDVWMYQKKFVPGHGYIYDKEVLLPADSHDVQALVHYNSQVLDALHIYNGPSHAEIMLTSKGPVLVEVAARITGQAHPALHNACLGHNQVNLTVDCYSDKDSFLNTVQKFPYKMKQHSMVVNLIYEGLPGKIDFIDNEVIQQIKSLTSVVQFVERVHEGDMIYPTRTLINSPGRIFMCHSNAAQLQEDYDSIQQMKRRLFRITPCATLQSLPLTIAPQTAQTTRIALSR